MIGTTFRDVPRLWEPTPRGPDSCCTVGAFALSLPLVHFIEERSYTQERKAKARKSGEQRQTRGPAYPSKID